MERNETRPGQAADGRRVLIPMLWTLVASSGLAYLTTVPAPASEISVQSATYGASCGVQSDNAGASVKSFCSGLDRCDYVVNYRVLGDPKPGCKKDFIVRYTCQGSEQVKTATAPAEAGFGRVASLDCSNNASASPASPSSIAPPVAKSAPSPFASDARIGFEVNGTCIGACPPAAPLQQGENQTLPIDTEVKAPNGDRFRVTGQANIASTNRFGQFQFEYESPFAVQYLGNASGGPSQDNAITATVYRAWAVGHDGQIDIKPMHSAALSLGLGEGSSAEAGLSGSKGARWVAIGRWPPASHAQQNPVPGAFHYSVAISDGVLNIWFRFGVHFAGGSLPGSFILIDSVRPPLLTFAQLRRGEGFASPADVACPPGIAPDQALDHAKRAAGRTANVMAMRCFLSAADSGDAGAENDVGYAAEHGVAVVPDPQEAARWYHKAAEQDDTQAQDRLAHLLATGASSSPDLAEAKRWTERAENLRNARSRVCAASSIREGMYQIDVAIAQDPELRRDKAIAALLTGATVRSTPRPPFSVRVADMSVLHGQFPVDPLSQGGDFLCQGFYTRGDDQAVSLLDQSDIDGLRAQRDAALYGSAEWQGLDDAIGQAELAGAVTDAMNQLMKAHDVYPEYFTVRALGSGRYRVTEINTPLSRPHFVDVDGPALETPP